MKSTRCFWFLRSVIILTVLIFSPGLADADDLVWATGRAIGSDGKPLKGAVVVVYDDNEKIVDYAYTDEKGEYALGIPEDILNLETKKGGGFLASVVGKTTRFVTAQATGLVQGAKTTLLAITSTQASLMTGPLAKMALDAGTNIVGGVEKRLTPKTAAEKQAKAIKVELKRPGVLFLKASAPNHTDYAGLAQAYWVQRETMKVEGKDKSIISAWLDPINFGAIGKPTTVTSDLLKIIGATSEPPIVPPGGKFKLSATIPAPADPQASLIVVARAASGQSWELKPAAPNVYSAEVTVDEKMPVGDQIITIFAYSVGEKPGRREDVEKEIEKLGGWDTKKEFTPNPLIMASRNRGEIKITVLPEKKPAKTN